MKRSTIIALLMAILVIGLTNISLGQATLPHYDGLDYTVGQGLQTQSGWTTLNSGDDLTIAEGSLSFTGLSASTGNKVTFAGAGIDAAKLFTQQTTGTVYYSFLLNITALGSLNATGGYFTGFNEGTSTNFGGTVWSRLDGAGFDLGINPRTTAANTQWTSGTMNVGTTAFIVLSYQIVSGTANDIVKMWVNPDASSFGATEPTATLTATNAGTDLLNLNRILIRQDATTTTPSIEMDELRVGLSWADVTTPGAAVPSILLGTTTLTGFNYTVGSGPSTDQSFTISGANLTADITVTAPTNYEISLTSGSGYTSPITLTQTGGTVASTTIYARLKAGLSVGTYNSELIACSSTGATTQNVTCNGSVSSLILPPAITVGSLTDFGDQIVNTTSAEKTYNVSGANLTADIIITPPVGFEVSTTSGSGFVANPSTLTLTQSGGTVSATPIYVRFKPTLVQAYSGSITHTSTGATQQDVAVSGNGVAAPPSIPLTALGTPVTENFDGMGTAGTAYISGWTAIRAAGTGTLNATLVMAVTDGNTTSGNIYNTGTTGAEDRAFGSLASGSTAPRFGACFLNSSGGSISDLSLAASLEQWKSGSSNTVNEVLTFEYSFDASSLSTGTWTALTSMNLNEILTSTTAAAAVNGNDPANQASISGTLTGLTWANGTTMWIRWTDTDNSGSDGLYAIDNFSITPSNGAIASISVSPSSLTGFNYTFGSGPSTDQSFTVSGNNLSADISIAAPADFEISLTSGSGYNSLLTLTQSGGTVATTTIYARLKAGLAAGNYNNELVSCSSSGAVTQNVLCSGSVTATGPFISVGTITAFSDQYQYTFSAEKTYTVSGINLTDDVTITPPAGFQISLTTGAGFTSNPVVITQTGGTISSTTIFVRFAPTLVQTYTGNITHTSAGAATQNVAVSGTSIAPISVSSIAALRAGTPNGTTVYKLTSEAIVTFQRPDFYRNQMYVEDPTGAIVVDDLAVKVLTDFNIGEGVTGLTGTLTLYNGLLEFVPVTDPGSATSSGNPVVPTAKTVTTITSADQAKLVSLSKVTFTETGTFVGGANYTVTDASGSMTFRTTFNEADYVGTTIPTTPVNMVALVGQFNTTMQVTPRFSDDITLYLPSWTSGYPKAENPSPAGFTAKVNLSDPGIAYYVVLPNGASAPTALQVKNGQDASGTPVAANLAGSITCALASTEYVDAIAGLTASTTYNVYFVAESYTNLQASAVMVPITTTSGSTAPVLLLPTVSGITSTSAILGGEISTDGGSAITERGTVWSTTSPVTIANNKLAEGGTTIGVFSHLRSSLPAGTQIFYAAYATNVIGTSLSSEGSFYTFAVEPSDHVTAFVAGTTTTTSIPLTWTDAAGAVPPTAYLIKGSSVDFTSITDPVDGVPETDALLVKNVAQGAQTVTFSGLALGTTYYFKIYPYTGASATINYKTAATVPTASGTTQGSTVYVWEGADNGSWTEATNWNPDRTNPLASDILQFSDGTTKTIIDVPTASIGQLIMSNNTTINLQAAAINTLTITGNGSGDDLVVPAGCALNLNKNVATVIQLAAGATAVIGGNMEFSLAAHKLLGTDASSIFFTSGSLFKTGTSFTGNAFGTTSFNSVIFESGSTLYFTAGSNPFGASQPNSVLVFQTGSLYKHQSSNTPSFAGRTYANVEFAQTGTITVTGAPVCIMDNLTITTGTLNFNLTTDPGHLIKGNIYVASGANLNFNPASAGTIRLNGSITQSVVADGTLSSGTLSTLEINNPQNVTLGSSISLNGGLKLTSGHIILGNNNLTLGSASVISGTPSSSSMIVAEGTGELRKTVTANGTFTFPVGDLTSTPEYSPVTLTFTSVPIGTGYAGVNLVNAAYPGVSGSYLNRYWNVTTSGLIDVTYDAAFSYVPADVIGNEADLYCYRVAPTTDQYAAANTTAHTLSAGSLTTLGTFTGKSVPPSTKTLNVKFFLEGLYVAGTGLMNEAQGTSGSQFGAGIADQVTIELRESASPYAVAYTFADVNLNTDGTVTINTVPGAASGDYYIVVNHRNSIQTWSALPVSFAGSGPVEYDFSTSASQAYGDNLRLMGTSYVIYGGDVSLDGIVDGTDMALIDNASTSILQGYNPEDVNGDGIVDGTDMALIDNNSTAIIQIIQPL